MQIPKQVKVGAFTYNIQQVENVGMGYNYLGEIDYAKLQLQIKQDMAPQRKYQTLWHEIFHGMFDILGYEMEETRIEQLSQVMCQIISDNPELFAEPCALKHCTCPHPCEHGPEDPSVPGDYEEGPETEKAEFVDGTSQEVKV